jgi:hypothetical protein
LKDKNKRRDWGNGSNKRRGRKIIKGNGESRRKGDEIMWVMKKFKNKKWK